MITITTTEGLQAFCERAAKAPYVTVDTEFLRETKGSFKLGIEFVNQYNGQTPLTNNDGVVWYSGARASKAARTRGQSFFQLAMRI